MITIITGKINSGKTTHLIKRYQAQQKGDGYACVKKMQHGLVLGYDLMRLKTRESISFIVRDKFYDINMGAIVKIGPYRMFNDALTIVKDNMNKWAESGINPLYLDEIGPLEMKNKGFHTLLVSLLNQSIDLVLVIREEVLDEACEKYDIKNPTLVFTKGA